MGQLLGLYWGFGGTSVKARLWLMGMNPTVHKFFIGNLDE